ncbi:MAG: type II toxin-antitoxin system VapC family toxin [Bacteroidetes bacterium]|nr:type II toxin-antitoxin system VapC family toxin [Bacteroidota bacterium]MBS1540334.1 type II toxin-antitoxin system VapC family toxin [Bacteroidota bacterium]
MKVSLDTHVALWWYQNPKLLSKEALAIMENDENTIYLSTVVVWEIMIKKMNSKIKVPDTIFDDFKVDFIELPIMNTHVSEIGKLKMIHRDPFDRMLLAQARVEKLTLMTRDKDILKYNDFQFIKA